MLFLPSFHSTEAGSATTRKVLWGGNLSAAVDGFFVLDRIPDPTRGPFVAAFLAELGAIQT